MKARTDADDLITIAEAASMLHRTQSTLRVWGNRGFAPNGMRLVVFRDELTTTRYFSRAQIIRIRDAIIRPQDGRCFKFGRQ